MAALAKYDLVRRGGSLTLTSGTAGIKPGKGAAVGGALNGGVLSLTKGLASELVDKKIRVNTVVPGLVQTPLWDKQGKTKEEQKEIFDKGSGSLPVGFVATPEHIAEAYLYAVRADYANGTLIEIGKLPNANPCNETLAESHVMNVQTEDIFCRKPIQSMTMIHE